MLTSDLAGLRLKPNSKILRAQFVFLQMYSTDKNAYHSTKHFSQIEPKIQDLLMCSKRLQSFFNFVEKLYKNEKSVDISYSARIEYRIRGFGKATKRLEG